MSERDIHAQNMVIPVTREEYERFLTDDTFLPDCMHLRVNEVPDCLDNCPKGLLGARFSYIDPDLDLEFEWYACATQEQLAQLWNRAVPVPADQGKRRIKFVAYQYEPTRP